MFDEDKIAKSVRDIILAIGEDPDREGLRDTPQRVAEMYAELFAGLKKDPKEDLEVGFELGHREMVVLKDIPFYSMCEHHLLPFFGKAHVAYIPDGQIMGLSKAARLVEVFSRRFQVQERLTEQVAQAVWDTIHPMGVGVVVEAYHLCMMMRGVEKQNSKTITSAMRGVFLSDKKTRDEFLRLSMAGHVLLS